MTIFNYARLSEPDKETIIRNHALFIETYSDDDKLISVFFYNGFFIEVSVQDEQVLSNIPYQKGLYANRLIEPWQKHSLTSNPPVRVASLATPLNLISRRRRAFKKKT